MISRLTIDWHSGKALGSHHWDLGSKPCYAGEMVMWSPSQTAGFPQGTRVSPNTWSTQMMLKLVQTRMICISCITCFFYHFKINKE